MIAVAASLFAPVFTTAMATAMSSSEPSLAALFAPLSIILHECGRRCLGAAICVERKDELSNAEDEQKRQHDTCFLNHSSSPLTVNVDGCGGIVWESVSLNTG
jgi:hypothetical protein